MKSVFKFLVLILIVSSCAKDEPLTPDEKTIICESDRYVEQIFTDTEILNIKYGSNINTLELNQDMLMKVY